MRGSLRAISAGISPAIPTVVVRNMQGAGTVIAANYVFNVSPKDGLELGLFAGNIVIDPLIGGTQYKYDAGKFNWIGAPSSDSNVCLSSPKSTFKTIDDVLKREMITGTSGTSTLDFPLTDEQRHRHEVQAGEGLRRQRGAPPGDGARRDRGLLRRRLQFHAHRGAADARQVQYPGAGRACRRIPQMPKVPFIFDYAKTDADRQIFTLVFGWLDLERPIAAPPGTPPERVRALREGFDKAMKDPALLADAEKVNVGIEPMSGAAIAKFVADVSRTPAAVTTRAAQILGRSK